jgi:hypothetical protein
MTRTNLFAIANNEAAPRQGTAAAFAKLGRRLLSTEFDAAVGGTAAGSVILPRLRLAVAGRIDADIGAASPVLRPAELSTPPGPAPIAAPPLVEELLLTLI